eukprot:5979383-Amphidinium_carterae.2
MIQQSCLALLLILVHTCGASTTGRGSCSLRHRQHLKDVINTPTAHSTQNPEAGPSTVLPS